MIRKIFPSNSLGLLRKYLVFSEQNVKSRNLDKKYVWRHDNWFVIRLNGDLRDKIRYINQITWPMCEYYHDCVVASSSTTRHRVISRALKSSRYRPSSNINHLVHTEAWGTNTSKKISTLNNWHINITGTIFYLQIIIIIIFFNKKN